MQVISMLLFAEISIALCARTGFFLEEADDTTYATAVDKRITDGLEDQILDILDLDEIPKQRSRGKRDGKVASFMAKLFNEMESNEAIAGNDLQQWMSADRIISVSPSEVISVSSSGLNKLLIPIDDLLSPSSSLLIAQLHLFISHHKDLVKLSVQSERNGALHDLCSVNIPPGVNSYSMNMTSLVGSWLEIGVDATLFVRIEPADGQPTATVPELLDTFIVTGFQEESRPIRRRSRRATVHVATDIPLPKQNKRADPFQGKSSNPLEGCRKQGLYVSFADLGWKNWVIAPEGYMAFYCGGACSFPLHNKMNATNHAIVQTLAHMVHPSRAVEPKCAPSQLVPMKILFVDNHENVVMKKYRDMIVQDCGCH